MALPPVVLIALFVGVPVALSVGFSFGMTGGLNGTAAAIGQNVHTADGLVTLDAYASCSQIRGSRVTSQQRSS